MSISPASDGVLRDAPSWDGRVLIDATNAIKLYAPPRVELYDFGPRTSTEVVAALAPGARVVNAFNHPPFFQLIVPVHDGERLRRSRPTADWRPAGQR